MTVLAMFISAGTGTSALLLLPAVVLASYVSRTCGLVAAVLSFGSLAYFFTPSGPAGETARREDVLALIVYLFVAVTTGSLVALSTALRNRAVKHERDALLRLDLKSRLMDGEEPALTTQRAADTLVDLHQLSTVTITLADIKATSTGHGPPGKPLVLNAGMATVELAPSARQPLSADDLDLVRALVAGLGDAIEREHLAEGAREAQAAASVAASRTSFMSVMGHNFRTPLTAVKASVSTLRSAEGYLEAGQRAELLENIQDEADRLERLIDKVLAVSRVRAGGLRPERRLVDFPGLVGAMMRRLEPVRGDRRFRMRTPEGLAPVRVDVLMMEQVMLNLLENALRYAPPQSEVGVELERRDESLELRVIDSGRGVPPEHRDRVFEEFFQAQPRRDGLGTGLGLNIVKGLVEAHDGRVWCEETPGGGATFVITLTAWPT